MVIKTQAAGGSLAQSSVHLGAFSYEDFELIPRSHEKHLGLCFFSGCKAPYGTSGPHTEY